MNIAVLSGKGGTGKTTISTNLVLALKANYVDCDVEEPNGFLFLKPEIKNTEKIIVEYPVVDDDKCVSCGECVNVCNFNALAKVGNDIMLFPKLCHGCGACEIACKHGALTYKKRQTGNIEKGNVGDINCRRGILNISEPMAVPVINQLLRPLKNDLNNDLNIVDCPPGTSCNVVNALKYADKAILVTEPTEFGLHDLKLAVGLMRMFNLSFGIIINKDDNKDNIIKKYCREESIDLIGTLPYNRSIAEIYSRGENLYDNLEYKKIFDELSLRVKEVLSWN